MGLTAAHQQRGEPADKQQHTQAVIAPGALHQAFQVQKEFGSSCFNFHLQISNKMSLMAKLTWNYAGKGILENTVTA